MKTIRLTVAQAFVRYIENQFIEKDSEPVRFIEAAFAIFGHGNVAGLGEALYESKDNFSTYRAHNEQSMALAAVAFAKQHRRKRAMMCTTSIGPGATNMVTAAALAHVNRLPILLVPGDTFATRFPDPVLQQIEINQEPNLSVNDCFKPVSRFFDRIARPEQLLQSLPTAFRHLLDPVHCGPVTISIPQDVQAEAYDFPESFFQMKVHNIRQLIPVDSEVKLVSELIHNSKRPMIIAGGGVHYAGAVDALREFASIHCIPVAETQSGKGALLWDYKMSLGGIGVTGSKCANTIANEADLIIAIGCRLQDFTTQSKTMIQPGCKLVSINVDVFDSHKHTSIPITADAKIAIGKLSSFVGTWQSSSSWQQRIESTKAGWANDYLSATTTINPLPSDANVLGAISRNASDNSVVVCAAGGLPGELHKLWRPKNRDGYHVEYGYSCMGYEIAGGLGVKMAAPDKEVCVVVGDGSYMMMNSEIATSVMLGMKLVIVVLDNRGFGCINRLQLATGNNSFNNLLSDCISSDDDIPVIDFVAHACSMGANGENVENINELEKALVNAKNSEVTYVIKINTDPYITTDNGKSWWDVAVPQVSDNSNVNLAFDNYIESKKSQRH